MAGFDLSRSISALDYNFGGGVRGTVPEPSSKSVNRFHSRIADNLKAIGRDVPDRSDSDAMAQLLATLTEDDLNAIHAETLDAVAELCDGSPSPDELASLGHRGFQAFLGWLTGELTNPEGSRPATKR